ncbi:LTR-retrotransposon skipper [Heterostelium album PN500]|uniref:LTR-retrotransposon skipper n=1 Tax=Heterostelium pallidum (strain ATCC 26659 / Pp 5 / PN500) TaxID=670386 RepID=D3AYH8_HETP5|nr:LTR-retrotransposon skipper [Heterostelium album PN500]EFA86005.1 LTR-retrotransposon skipper [Heterostelium album PN500]|eukprot:XP_020438111.1 LTR-retrotransposon skipper [Heterostelium album PN500]
MKRFCLFINHLSHINIEEDIEIIFGSDILQELEMKIEIRNKKWYLEFNGVEIVVVNQKVDKEIVVDSKVNNNNEKEILEEVRELIVKEDLEGLEKRMVEIFSDVIVEKPPNFKIMERDNDIIHKIVLKKDAVVKKQHQFRRSYKEEMDIQMKVDELEELGIVEKVPEEFLDQVVESPIFAVYKNNVFDRLMDLESRKYTAFRTRKGIYWYLRMAMGLNGAPARFAEFIEENFSDIVKNYFDDLISGDVTLEENVVRVIRMLIRCRETNIFKLEIEILGRTIRENIINSSSKKTEILDRMEYPTTPKQVQRTLGFFNYYRKFVDKFVEKTKHLEELRVFKTDFEINDEAKREFDLLRKELKNTVDLMLPDPTKEYFVYTDASDIGISVVICQKDEKGVLKPVLFSGRRLKPGEQIKSIGARELLAIKYFLKKHSDILLGPKLNIYTDHFNLLYLKDQAILTKDQLKALEVLSQFNYEINHIEGKNNVGADVLSRLQCYQIPLDFSYLDEIKNSYKSSKDVELVKLRHKESWRESNGLIFILDKNFNERLLLVDEKHIKEIAEGVGVDISMDFMELPKSVNGYDYVLVVVDRFSKYTTIIPTTKEITALGTAKLIHQHVFSLFGLPLSIVSDRDTRFTSELWLELFKKVGSKLRMSVPRHPQSDGQSERTNRRIRSMLRKLSLEFKDKWDEEIKNIQFAINSTYNSTIKLSPFEVVLGYIPVSPINMFRNNNTSNREWIREMVKDSLLDKQLDMLEADGTIKNKPTYQIGDWMFVKDEFINLEVDWNTNTGSINNKNRGPFKITKIFNNGINVELELDYTTKRHKVFNINQLVQFKLNKDNESLVKGIEPDIIDNEEEFEIEQIIGDRMYRKKKQYQIKWLGYPLDKATWQYSKNMDHAKDLIKEYENNKKQQIQSKKKNSCITRAGEKFRIDNNRMRSGNEDGPLHDLPDFHYADGRPAPVTPKQMKWQTVRANRENIINELKKEVIAEQSMVTMQIDAFKEKIDQKIAEKKQKKVQMEKLFKEKNENTPKQ